MMKGGYFMVDMAGLNLGSTSAQSNTTLYPQLVQALAIDKPVFASGAVIGAGKEATPAPMTVYRNNSTTIIALVDVYSCSVTASSVTVSKTT